MATRKTLAVSRAINPTVLPNEELTTEILERVRKGMSAQDIAKEVNVEYGKILRWKNNALESLWNRADMLYQLDTVEAFSKRLMAESAGKKDTSLKAIQQKEAEFLRKQLVVAKTKYNDTPQIAIQVNLPSPIVDLGKLESE